MRIIFDIDGVLADSKHREKYLPGERSNKTEWDRYYSLAPQDKVIRPMADLCNSFWGPHAAMSVTMRPEECRADTEAWFKRYDVKLSRLVMSKHYFHATPEGYYQEKINMIKNIDHVDVVVEDQDELVKRLRAEGYAVLQYKNGE